MDGAGASRRRGRVPSPASTSTGHDAPAPPSHSPLDRREPTQRHPVRNWPFLYSVAPGRGVVKNVTRPRSVLDAGIVTKNSRKRG